MLKRVLKSVIISSIFLCSMLMFTGCGKKAISLNDYFEYEIEGYNNYGVIDDYFDYVPFAEAMEIEKGSIEELDMELFVESYVVGEWDEVQNLSNGDVVKYTWEHDVIDNYNKDKSKKFKLVAEDIEVKVEGLEELPEIDIFEDIKITVDGISGIGEAEVSSEKYADFRFTCTPNTGLANGDVVTVSPKDDVNEDYIIRFYDARPKTLTYSYTVEGLPEFLNDLSKLDDKTKDLLHKNLLKNRQDEVNKYSYLEEAVPQDMGYVLVVPKDASLGDDYLLFNFIKEDIKFKKSKSKIYDITRYTYLCYKNAMVYSDGSIYVDMEKPEGPEFSEFWGTGTMFRINECNVGGYPDYDSMYNDVIQSKLGKYSVVDGVLLDEFVKDDDSENESAEDVDYEEGVLTKDTVREQLTDIARVYNKLYAYDYDIDESKTFALNGNEDQPLILVKEFKNMNEILEYAGKYFVGDAFKQLKSDIAIEGMYGEQDGKLYMYIMDGGDANTLNDVTSFKEKGDGEYDIEFNCVEEIGYSKVKMTVKYDTDNKKYVVTKFSTEW